MTITKPERTLHRFFATPIAPCPYLPDKVERKLFTPLTGGDPNKLHDMLSSSGFRRSQNIVYKPACKGCQSCIPVRVRASDFSETRSILRIERKNSDLNVFEMPPIATAEQFHLFQRYQKSRHNDSGMADMDFGDYQEMVEDTIVKTSIIEFRDDHGALLATSLTDRMGDGFSLCYSFFDPSFSQRSLGTHVVIWHIRNAQKLKLEYVYLGYWIEESQKMSYKKKFKPLEGLNFSKQIWQDL